MVKNDIKYYEVTVDSDVYAISLVTNPAIESDFIFLSKEKPLQVCLDSDEKHLVVGAALIPDFPIYRNQGGKEFYIQFSKESIEKLAYNYLQTGSQYNTTTQHNLEVDDVCVVESWLKLSENDKSKDYGLDVPIGSWIVALKVENEDVWRRIKSGELKGFSVESFVNLKEINLEMNDKENLEKVEINESFWEKLKSIIKEALTIPATNEEEAAEVAEEVVEDIKTDTEVEPEVKEEEVAMSETEEVKEEEVELESTEEVKETEEVELEKEVEEKEEINLQSVVDELNQKIEELNSQLDELKKENLKLSKQPSTKPINSKGDVTEGSNFDRMLAIMNGSAFRK